MREINTYARGKMLYLDIRQNGLRERLASGVKDSKEAREFFKKNTPLILQNRAYIKKLAKDFIDYENALYCEKLLREEKEHKAIFSEDLRGELEAFFNSFIVHKRGTQKSYKNLQKTIIDFFQSEKLRSVKDFEKRHIVKFILFCEGKNMRNSSIKLRFSFLKRFINYCVDEGLREAISIKMPRLKMDEAELERSQKEALDYAEISLFIKNAPSPLKEYLSIAFFTGARTGEILALKKGDIDFVKKEIHIRKTRISKKETNSPKNRFSYRTIDMLKVVENVMLKLVEGKKDDDFIFEKYSNLHTLFKELLIKLNAKPMRLYETRHTFASLMLSRGEDVEWVSRRMLGHANSAMTYAKYARLINKSVKERAKFINEEDF
ncbi:tyrosine-type recombinase/integrase [Campylobacter vulpis]|uniref:tyrosine-type recombinase/integrase n=1 Tax=Campylobacter vulpis TaxID=1655500 RepID=UPI001BD06005|nr:site-specific integrase [Campylobacter vulpis]